MKKLLFFIFLLPLQLIAQYNWQDLPNAPKSYRCDDVYFLTPQMGWAIHPYYGYLFPNQYGQIYKTKDGGNTWQLMKDSSKTFFRSVGFIDSLHGWIGNLADTSHDPFQSTLDTIPLYYTNDGGKTLTPVNFGFPHPAGICGISVVNDSVVYAYGRYLGPATFVKTTDKGVAWTVKDMSAYASGLVDGHFLDKDTGFITGCNGNDGVILHTNDGGTTWQTVYHGARNDSEIVWKIFFPSRNIGYASIEYIGNNYSQSKPYNTYFIKTIDGGKTWIEHPFISTYDEEGIGFINDTVGWIGGDYLVPTYITFDGGINWAPDYGFGVHTPPYYNFHDAYFINRFRSFGDTLMYASGNTVYKLGGQLTGIKEFKNAILPIYSYPNPFSQNINIDVGTKVPANITMFNMLGENIGSWQMNKGLNSIDTREIPSGVYILQIRTKDGILNRKLIKVN